MTTLPGHGSILFVDALEPELAPVADVLGSLGDMRIVSPADGLTALARFGADVIVARDGADLSGARFLRQAAVLHPSAVRILLVDGGGEPFDDSDAVILRQPVDLAAVRAICAIALRGAAAERAVRAEREENERLRVLGNQVPCELVEDAEGLACYEGIITRSPRMRRVLHLLGTIEATDTTVLIQGETGTGKELAARAIHRRSRRRRGRFVAVNLGSISDPLRESELFGHVRGAFTGARDNRAGLFAEADGGTLFLDEVGDASPGLQVALLRVLEEGTITPVGADRTRRVDVRIISGTNRDLEELVRRRKFRRDLYYRLNVFPIELPPLRERPEDIFPLAGHFLSQAATTLAKSPPGISREARGALEAHGWEGNVRELRNVVERAAIVCRGGLIIAADLPLGTISSRPAARTEEAATTIAIPAKGATLQQLEQEIFLKTLVLAAGNQSEAARMLGLCESTFRFRLGKLGLSLRRTAYAVAQPAARPGPAATS